MTDKITIHIGALATAFEEQLNKQGYTLGDKAKRYQDIYKSVLNVYFFGLFTRGEFEKINQKFVKSIVKEAIKIDGQN